MKTAAVIILNYNTACEAISLAEGLLLRLGKQYRVILVDNASADVDMLRDFVSQRAFDADSGRLALFLSPDNVGYAKGNNIGLRASRAAGDAFAFVLNPDMEIPDIEVFDDLVDHLSGHRDIAVVGPEIINTAGDLQLPPMRVTSHVWFNLLYPISGICCKIVNRFRERAFGLRNVFTVHGCFFALNLEAWERVGYFDEATFLYHEESIMADRLASSGYSIAYAPRHRVIHKHVYTSDFRDNAWNKASWDYYSRRYLRKPSWYLMLHRVSEKYQRCLNNALDEVRACLGRLRTATNSGREP